MAVSVGMLFQSTICAAGVGWRGGGGGGETGQFCDMGQGTGVGDQVLGVCLAGMSAGAVLCVDRGEVVMEFKELVQSVFSAVYLEGRPVECSDHQVHTLCLPVAMLYTADSLARLCTVSRALTPLVLCGSHTD